MKSQGQQYVYGETERQEGKFFTVNISALVYESQKTKIPPIYTQIQLPDLKVSDSANRVRRILMLTYL